MFDIDLELDGGNVAPNESLESTQFEEWQKSRLGKITGSTFGKLIVSDKKGGYKLSTSQTAKTLIYKIAWERLLLNGDVSNGLGRLNFSSAATNHGNDYEGAAVLEFEKQTGLKVDYIQNFICNDDWVGGTPDGYIGKDGIIEIKAPFNGGNHIQTLIEGEIYNKEHYFQIQGYLWLTGRKWCKYVTYDPDLIEGVNLCVLNIDRDEDVIDAIAKVMEEVKDRVIEVLENKILNG